MSLGNRILRSETAGIVASAVILYEFGDMNINNRARFGASSSTRAVWAGGYGAPNGSTSKDDMDYNTIATKGDSVDFGNLTQARGWSQASSTGHGGL